MNEPAEAPQRNNVLLAAYVLVGLTLVPALLALAGIVKAPQPGTNGLSNGRILLSLMQVLGPVAGGVLGLVAYHRGDRRGLGVVVFAILAATAVLQIMQLGFALHQAS